MTCEAAKRILHPGTTREALAEIGFKGKEKLQDAVDEACLKACAALDKQIPEPPVVLNQSCKKRHAGCHAECEEFKVYRQRLEAEKKKARKTFDAESAADEFRIKATCKNMKGKQRQV